MMTAVFRLNLKSKSLSQIPKRSMAELGLTEPYDLEAWLTSSSSNVFGREVLWIARQDRVCDDQRSDLIGIDQGGDLLITELKRGILDESAITQALGYAAEYSRKTADELAKLFGEHSAKDSSTGLISKALTIEDAQAKLSAHVGTETELNEAQILMLIGEDFTAGALAICDYLNESSGEGTFSFECWKYTVFQEAIDANLFCLEQILPPPSVRQAIDERRQANKAKKYARDPARKDFMYAVMDFLAGKEPGLATRSRGASYDCSLNRSSWQTIGPVNFSVHHANPRLTVPTGLAIRDTGDLNVSIESLDGGKSVVKFNGVECTQSKFDDSFGNRLLKAINQVEITAATEEHKVEAPPVSMPAQVNETSKLASSQSAS